MAGGGPADGQTYSTPVGLLYIFNLIVGTGALALPKAFQTAGYGLSIALLLVSSFVSYICATFIIECMGIANAYLDNDKEKKRINGYEGFATMSEQEHKAAFEINKRIEVSEMAHMFLGKFGVLLSYLFLTVYLFGDLAIYSTAVPKSLMNVLCSSTNGSTPTGHELCHEHWPEFMTRYAVYRLSVFLFMLVVTPMVLVGITRTKYVQLATSFSRWTAFTLMIVLAAVQLMKEGPEASPPAANLSGFGSLFGVTVYAFMCHHSIPSLITPMRKKNNVNFKLFGVYSLVIIFYLTLSLTGSFAFASVQDVYTFNFFHDKNTSFFYLITDYFLMLFPVFTLTSNYPIVAITLINNLKVLVALFTGSESRETDTEQERLLSEASSSSDEMDVPPREISAPSPAPFVNPTVYRIVLPIVTLLLPTLLSMYTDNVLLLATITGSYPGVGVQFIIPSILVIGARSYVTKDMKTKVPSSRSSPFKAWFWPFAMLAWSAFTIFNVTVNLFHGSVH
ncbi:hypothetical protein L596_004161 [Steinernema carpocapsae]|uniref:Amino acid transporter transmembrane domain-containing protein n=1 Tax=Steinernema carpocapsae TaxID=34508 RepID=A0A4U8UUV2_STECR|nr:hypothetical protein L596_004161 [Steinernema carpocapsae]